MTLTIIGAGAMGIAMAEGLKAKYRVEFVARDLSKMEELKGRYLVYPLNKFNIEGKNVILAIKPHALKSVGFNLRGRAETIYSILAGVSISDLKSSIDARSYIRAMPNVSAKLQASTTIITGDIETKGRAMRIFSTIGDTFWVDSEREIDIGTAVAGSGPALLSLVAEAMMDGLVREGMKRGDAMSITNSLFKGFAPLLTSSHPAIIKDSVMSPAGTTAQAYYTLEESGVRASFIKAIERAFKQTQG